MTSSVDLKKLIDAKTKVLSILIKLNTKYQDMNTYKSSLYAYNLEEKHIWTGKKAEKAENTKDEIVSAYGIYMRNLNSLIQYFESVNEKIEQKLKEEAAETN